MRGTTHYDGVLRRYPKKLYLLVLILFVDLYSLHIMWCSCYINLVDVLLYDILLECLPFFNFVEFKIESL